MNSREHELGAETVHLALRQPLGMPRARKDIGDTQHRASHRFRYRRIDRKFLFHLPRPEIDERAEPLTHSALQLSSAELGLEDHEQHATLRDEIEMRSERAPQSFVERLDAGGRLQDAPIKLRHLAIVQRQRQLFRILEIRVAKAFADPGVLRDRLHGERLEARIENYRRAYVKQMLAALLGGKPSRLNPVKWSNSKCHQESSISSAIVSVDGSKVNCSKLETQQPIFI